MESLRLSIVVVVVGDISYYFKPTGDYNPPADMVELFLECKS